MEGNEAGSELIAIHMQYFP